ncbi:class I SAM-dependent methyltransferase [Gracilibacillus xinjiangensis]|uniref:Class I SAM-dependent methyltransferase n=1 Tax=Gracilibacillus xinjiangensis TaxID=1193282 RepID=A0ABV8WRB5_9BACI
MDIKTKVQDQFGKTAGDYVLSELHRNGTDLPFIVKMADLTGEEKVLDVATGGGHTANALAPFAKEVTAFDLTKKMLAAAEQFIVSNGHKNVAFVQGDAEKLPFADESFDIVTCRIAPHHFPDIDSFIAEVYRVLKHEGRFLLDDNVAPENKEWDQFYNTIEKRRDPSHHRAWKKSEWLQKIERNGFEVSEWIGFRKTFVFESWFNRMKQPEEEKKALNSYIIKAGPDIHKKFRVKVNHGTVESFEGEAILLKAVKY